MGKRGNAQLKDDNGPKLNKKNKKTVSETQNTCSEIDLKTEQSSKHKTSKRKKISNEKLSKDLPKKDKVTQDKVIELNKKNVIETKNKEEKRISNKKNLETNDDPINIIEETKREAYSKNNDLRQNKKILFKDDTGEPDDALPFNNFESKKKPNKNNKLQEEPKDEEIDQFCEEIEEEDNVQYENWVKLIEEKLGKKSESRKNKTK